LPQNPQFCASRVKSTQVPLHGDSELGQLVTHWLP